MSAAPRPRAFAALLGKRCLDLVVASVALVLLSPLLAILAVAVWVGLGRPVLLRQTRPGKDARIFRLWKLRTMTEARDAAGALLPDGERLTPLGLWLRRTSLDELPQLFNVLSGELSLVGPRPLLVRYLPRYSARQGRRHLVKPGITGWAQVHGRNASDWATRLEDDVWYVDHWSLWLDCKILAMTVGTVLRRSGVKAGAGSELDEFWGEQGPPAAGPRAYPVEADEPLGAVAGPADGEST